MPKSDEKITSADQFQLITDKRLALERLIKIAEGIHHQQDALKELALSAKPSQKFPVNVVKFFKGMKDKLSDLPATEIVGRMEKIEAITEKNLKTILNLTTVDVNQLRDDELDDLNVEDFATSITEFKRRTQSALALRYVLQQRGVAIHPFKLPISQEQIAQKVEQLKQKESSCVKQIRKEINVIIKDTEGLLKQYGLPMAIKQELNNVKKAMLSNIEHLDKGGLVTDIPHVFEVITLETPTPQVINKVETKVKPSNEELAKRFTEQQFSQPDPKPMTIWQLIKAWLNSPWNTSWSSLKNNNKKTSKKK